jgi:iron complex outermembrane receptor protein
MSICRFFATVLISLALAVPVTTLAQDELEEIVVTARKVGESIQDIPLSITAFGSEQIRDQQITSIEDIAQFTPGLHISNDLGSRSDPALRFRGMDPPSTERQQQLASAFVDGVYLPGGSTWVSMNDIERVEVVKGPQSAFFGRATFGGAINFITKTPGNDWAGDVQLILGDSGRQDLWLSAEGPIIEDKLAFRASGRLYEYDGAWDNPFPGGGDLGAQETSSGSVTLYFTPTEDISIKLRHVYSEDRDGLGTSWIVSGEDNNCGPFTTDGVTGSRDYYCGTLSRGLVEGGSRGLGLDTSDPVDKRYKSEMGLERFTNLTTLEMNFDIGDYTLTSVTGNFTESSQDMKETITNEILSYVAYEDESFTTELRLTSPQENRLRWMIGAYYLDLTYFKGGGQAGFPCPGTGPFCFDPTIFQVSERGGRGLFGVNPVIAENVENTSIFGSIAFDITDKLTVNLELRREEETLENASSVIQEAPPLDSSTDALAILTAQPFGGAELPLSADFTATLPRFIVDYKLSDDTTLYASYAEGNNPGGFNPEVIQMEPTVAFPAFSAETGIGYDVKQGDLKAYEFGAKHSFANGRGFVNGAVYLNEWNNQVYQGFLASVDSNGDGRFVQGSDRLGGQIDYKGNGSSDIYGFEVAASYVLSDNWRATASYNYNDTEIKELLDAQHGRVWGSSDASGKEIARSPKHAATVAVDFNTASNAWGGDGEWFARWDAWYQSESWTWVINLAETEAALLHNLRGGWRNDRYSIMAWVENVTDDDSVLAARRFTGSFLTGRLGYRLSLPEPRTYGVTFSARFGE